MNAAIARGVVLNALKTASAMSLATKHAQTAPTKSAPTCPAIPTPVTGVVRREKAVVVAVVVVVVVAVVVVNVAHAKTKPTGLTAPTMHRVNWALPTTQTPPMLQLLLSKMPTMAMHQDRAMTWANPVISVHAIAMDANVDPAQSAVNALIRPSTHQPRQRACHRQRKLPV
jgi:hypothetical protein